MLSLILAAWHALRRAPASFDPDALPWRRRAAGIEPSTPWPRPAWEDLPKSRNYLYPPDSPSALQLLLLRRLAQCGERWVEMAELDIDGAASPLLDAAGQLADHGFVKLCVTRPQGGRAKLLAARVLPKGIQFIAAYAAHARPSTPVSAVPTAVLAPARGADERAVT